MVGTLASASFCFLLAIGQMTTDGSVKNTKLPPAPIDNCPAVNASVETGVMLSTSFMPVAGLDASLFVSDMIRNFTYLASEITPPTPGLSVVNRVLGSTATMVEQDIIPEP